MIQGPPDENGPSLCIGTTTVTDGLKDGSAFSFARPTMNRSAPTMYQVMRNMLIIASTNTTTVAASTMRPQSIPSI